MNTSGQKTPIARRWIDRLNDGTPTNVHELAMLRSAHRVKQRGYWSGQLIACVFVSRSGGAVRSNIMHLTKLLADDMKMRAVFESICRLNGTHAANTWLKARVQDERPVVKVSRDEALERARAARRRLADKAESEARAALAKYTRRLAIDKRLVKKWAAKVRYYDRKTP